MVASNHELRALAREQLKGNWGISIAVGLIYIGIFTVLSYIPQVGYIVQLLISGAFTLGIYLFFIQFPRGGVPQISQLFEGFQNFGKSLGLYLLISLFTFLWTLLLVIPGIIASFRYSQAFYILNDNPNMKVMDAIRQSSELMDGYKWRYFLLQLSFIGWALLSIVTFGIGFIFLLPYVLTANANFYDQLSKSHAGPKM
nr:DUF975 family protein [Paenibacillus turpanensis]